MIERIMRCVILIDNWWWCVYLSIDWGCDIIMMHYLLWLWNMNDMRLIFVYGWVVRHDHAMS